MRGPRHARLFFSGTPRWPSLRAIASEIDSWGCRFNAMTEKEYTAYYVYGAAEYVTAAIDLISDLIHHADVTELAARCPDVAPGVGEEVERAVVVGPAANRPRRRGRGVPRVTNGQVDRVGRGHDPLRTLAAGPITAGTAAPSGPNRWVHSASPVSA
ncbi:MAG: insulinase family protein [Pseudonocardiaceae bacterium]